MNIPPIFSFANSLVRPVVFADSKENWLSGILHASFIIGISFALLVFLTSLIPAVTGPFPGQVTIHSFAYLSIFVIGFILLKLRHLNPCVNLSIGLVFIYTNIVLFAGDGLHDAILILIPAVFLPFSLMVGRTYFWILSASQLIVVLFIGVAELQGILKNDFSHVTSKAEIFVHVFLLAAVVLLIRLVTNNLQRALNSAQRNARNYKEIFDATGEGILILELSDSRILDFNRSAERIFGLNRQPDRFIQLRDICRDSELYEADEMSTRLQEKPENELHLVKLMANDLTGNEFWIEMSLKLTKIEGVERVMVVVRDIPDMKVENLTLLNHQAQLEQLVTDRTAELEGANQSLVQEIEDRKKMEIERIKLEEQLKQSQKMEAIGTLAGGIAHDFNNLLAMMLGYSELLVSSFPDDSKESGFLNEIFTAGDRATDLVSQILTFSRIEETELKPLSLVPLLKEVFNMIRATLPSTIDIRRSIRVQDDIQILANATQIHQVIINICTNAAHAMREKGGTLEFQLAEVRYAEDQVQAPMLKAGSYLELSIKDTGHGIPVEIKERIFDPFYTTKEIGEGTGLGLSIVHGIMANHNGKISVVSEPDIGTTFHIFFPVVASTETEDEVSETVDLKGTERILIVEDEISLAGFYEISLTKLGYQVTLAHNGAEALEKFQSHPSDFDLIFSDQTMPKMTGTELSKHALQIRPDIPIILATGYDASQSDINTTSLKIASYLRKPIKMDHLSQLIRETLNEAKEARGKAQVGSTV